MRRSTIAIAVPATALVASNACLAYRFLDAGGMRSYQGALLNESQQALAQALAIIKAD